jgi:hypothetical protein
MEHSIALCGEVLAGRVHLVKHDIISAWICQDCKQKFLRVEGVVPSLAASWMGQASFQ